MVVTFLGLFSHAVGREEQLQTNVTGVCWQWFNHTGFAPAHGMCALPVYTAQALGCSSGNFLRQALGCMPFPGLSHSGSGSWVLHKGAGLLGTAFCACPRSEQLRWPGVWRVQLPQLKAVTYRLPRPSCSVFWVYNERSFSGVPCVSSGELISGCNPPRECRPSRIPRSLR